MSLEFDFYLSPNCVGTNRKRYHARPANLKTVTAEEFIEKIAKHSATGAAETRAVLTRAADMLAELLADGNHVFLEGIGGFQVSLECPETRTVTATRSGSVSVKSVAFKPSKDLVATVRKKAVLKRARVKKHSVGAGEMDVLMLKLDEYFRTNRFITVKTLVNEFGLLRSTAQRRIQKLVEMGKIRNVNGDKRHPLYEVVM